LMENVVVNEPALHTYFLDVCSANNFQLRDLRYIEVLTCVANVFPNGQLTPAVAQLFFKVSRPKLSLLIP
jgi:hypothetical protein